MKKVISSLVMVMVLALGLAFASPASGQEVKKSVTINRDTKLGDAQLSRGTYTLHFDQSKDGELVVMQGKKEVAKVAYKMTKLSKSPAESTVVYSLATDGSFTIKRIELKGAEFALSIE